MMKLIIGVPSHLNHFGIALSPPLLFRNSERAPWGQKRPHHALPNMITEARINGNHSPQTANFANKTKLFHGFASSGGAGRNRGIRNKDMKSMNIPKWIYPNRSLFLTRNFSILSIFIYLFPFPFQALQICQSAPFRALKGAL